jgi:hypothetical protein
VPHAGVQAISRVPAAITFWKVRQMRRVLGSHSRYRTTSAPGCSGTSSKPELVPWSMTYPRGSLRRGPSAAPDTLNCCAVPTEADMPAPVR